MLKPNHQATKNFHSLIFAYSSLPSAPSITTTTSSIRNKTEPPHLCCSVRNPYNEYRVCEFDEIVWCRGDGTSQSIGLNFSLPLSIHVGICVRVLCTELVIDFGLYDVRCASVPISHSMEQMNRLHLLPFSVVVVVALGSCRSVRRIYLCLFRLVSFIAVTTTIRIVTGENRGSAKWMSERKEERKSTSFASHCTANNTICSAVR